MQSVKFSSELSVLIRASLNPKDSLEPGTSGSELNWDLLGRLADWHQVRPVLFDYLNENKDIEAPPEFFTSLKAYTFSQTITNLTFLKISVDLYKQLQASNVHTFLMKGVVWAWMFYDKPGFREFGDVDFFVKRTDVRAALEVLGRNGFEPDSYRAYLLRKERIANVYLETDYQLPLTPVSEHPLQSLEIQWNLSYPRYCYSFSWQELTHEMQTFAMQDAEVDVPKIEDQLLMMLVHHAGVEQWDKLKYMTDFVCLLRKNGPGLDWNYVKKVAVEKGFFNLLKESLGVVKMIAQEDFLKNAFPESTQTYPTQGFLNEILEHWENGRPIRKSKSWRIFAYNMRHRDGWRQKFLILWGHITYSFKWELIWQKIRWYRLQAK